MMPDTSTMLSSQDKIFIILGRYSIYMWTWNVNVKRDREKPNKRFSIVCFPYRRERDVNVKREFMT